eukprot:12415746-Karenia_brevis.AAC.1
MAPGALSEALWEHFLAWARKWFHELPLRPSGTIFWPGRGVSLLGFVVWCWASWLLCWASWFQCWASWFRCWASRFRCWASGLRRVVLEIPISFFFN